MQTFLDISHTKSSSHDATVTRTPALLKTSIIIVASISSDPFAIGTSAVFSFSSSAAPLLIIITSPTAFLLNLLLSAKGGVGVVPFRKNPHKQLVIFRCPRLLLFAPNEEEEVAMQRTLIMLLLIVFVER
jgi:hypothetical protein